MALCYTLIACLVGTVVAQPAWVPPTFRAWAAEFGKKYRSEFEWQRAFKNYDANEQIIKDLNADGEDAAVYGHTRFSDMLPHEWKAKVFGRTMPPEEGKRGAHGSSITPSVPDSMPTDFDWRASAAVTPVKDQSNCGSCWAESAVGNMESVWYIANKATMKAPVSLSTEQVLECDAHDDACYGGFPKGAYEYVVENGGLGAEQDYPYNINGHTICLANQTFNKTCGDGICDDPPLTQWCDVRCSDKRHKSVAHFSSWHALPANEGQIAAQLFQTGPVSVGIDASGGLLGVLFPWLQFYKKGVANPKRCTTKIDHAVLLVGYGEDNGQKYWTIKNSWGAKWGEQGFFRMIRGTAKCGVDLLATTAVPATNTMNMGGNLNVV